MALGVGIPVRSGVLVLAAVHLATMAPVVPANLGVYEAAAFAACRLTGIGAETALGLVVQHAAYLLPLAGVGWGLLVAEGLRPASVVEAAEDPGR